MYSQSLSGMDNMGPVCNYILYWCRASILCNSPFHSVEERLARGAHSNIPYGGSSGVLLRGARYLEA